ncbi:DUF3079 domain-containing protein [Duganella sp. P38]|uniref:DUF3079 domain-containing protein n=1 Tax=Duganella sp. P38 TaxID=3423949 RepID=UPI003D7BDF08
MAKNFPIRPARPELICWGCDKYCAHDAMICGNGADRTQHPIETFGEGWETFGLNAPKSEGTPAEGTAADAPNTPSAPHSPDRNTSRES